MAARSYSDSQLEEVRMLLAQGVSVREIGSRLGLSPDAVFRISKQKPVQPLTYNGPGIRADKKYGHLDWEETCQELKRFQKLKKKASFSQDHATIELGDGNSPVALVGFSDQHIGSWGCDYDNLIRTTKEFMAIPNLFIALLGDYGQYAIKLRSVLEVSDNILPPELQTQFIESWFEYIWPKVAFATWDNHAVERQEKLAGESSVKKMLSKKVVYFNGIGHVDIAVGKQVYRGAVSHMFRGRSMLNPVHACMRYMRFEGQDRDFAMMGDSHVPGMLKYTDGEKTRVAINTGSLQSNSGYAKRYFSLTTHPTYPLVVFSPDKHEMTPFWSLGEWIASKKNH